MHKYVCVDVCLVKNKLPSSNCSAISPVVGWANALVFLSIRDKCCSHAYTRARHFEAKVSYHCTASGRLRLGLVHTNRSV